jgi:hypothetical protein
VLQVRRSEAKDQGSGGSRSRGCLLQPIFHFLGSAKVEKKLAVEEEPAIKILQVVIRKPVLRVGFGEGERVGSGGDRLKSCYFNCNKK